MIHHHPPCVQRHSRVVHVRRRLVDHQDLAPLQYRPRQTHQLLLTHAQIRPALAHHRLQTVGQHIGHQLLQLHLLQRPPDLGVGIVAELVEVAAHGAGEEHGILWNDGDVSTHVVETERGDVDAVDEDATLDESAHAKERLDEGALAGACSSDDADLLGGVDVERDVGESEMRLGIG